MKGVNRKYFKKYGRETFERLRDNKTVEVTNENVFKRSLGAVLIRDEIKKISEIKKRNFIND